MLDTALFNTCAHTGIGTIHITRRISDHLGGNGRSDLGHGDIILNQMGRGDLDNRLRGSNTANGGAGNTGSKQTGDKLIGKQAQLFRGNRTGDNNIGDTITPSATGHGRFFGLIGQGCDLINSGLNIVRSTGHIPARLELKRQIGTALTRSRGTAFNTFNRQQSRLKHLHNSAIYVFGTGTAPRDLDVHIVDDHIRKELGAHIGGGEKTSHQHQHKQQICSRLVAGKITQQPARSFGNIAHHGVNHPSGIQCG